MKCIQITSSANPLFKKWKKLHTKKGRTEQNAFLIEGETLINEAKVSALTIHAFITTVDASRSDLEVSGDIPFYQLNSRLFQQLAQTVTPSGVMAVVSLGSHLLDEVIFHGNKRVSYLLLDSLQDPGNIGTLIRTAEACGISAIFLGHNTVDVTNSKVIRSAMGSLFRVPLVSCDFNILIPRLKENGVVVVGTSPRAQCYIQEFSYPEKIAILLGNEARGIQEMFQRQVDMSVSVPMYPPVESLNVATTGAMLLYEKVRQENEGSGFKLREEGH